MRKLIYLAAGLLSLAWAGVGQASDHLLTAVGAGGLTTSSQPFQNGTNNRGRSGDIVPGQGSPLSGEDHTTPAVESESLLTHHFTQPNLHANPGNGTLRTPPPVLQGMTAPSGHSRR
jgi:hypothetical protein